jgi:hypothetical protein
MEKPDCSSHYLNAGGRGALMGKFLSGTRLKNRAEAVGVVESLFESGEFVGVCSFCD